MSSVLRVTRYVAICVLLVACQPAATPTPTDLLVGDVSPFITVAPPQALPGQSLTISGAEWRAGEEISLAVQPADASLGVGLSGGSVRADQQGRFQLAVMLPPDMRPGVWVMTARGAEPVRIASVTFAVLAPTPAPGALMTLTPTNLPAPTVTDTPTSLPVSTPTATQSARPTATHPPSTPTRTPGPSTPTATPPVITEWRGDYFNNPTLAGNPAFTRNDPAINFNWGSQSPDPRLNADGFSARWTRRLYFDAGLYRFTVRVDDGARVFVNGVMVIDEWRDGSAREVSTDLTLSAGDHDLRIEYYERGGAALISFNAARVTLPPTATPSLTPRPATSTSTASPTPSATPSATPIPLPTQAPAPTNTPRPTPIPVPTSTPTRPPTATPSA
ncbi:MAG: PA14 domain-containing protein, partial [Anaerolineae bacterium]